MAFSCVLFLKEECDGCARCEKETREEERWTREAQE